MCASELVGYYLTDLSDVSDEGDDDSENEENANNSSTQMGSMKRTNVEELVG